MSLDADTLARLKRALAHRQPLGLFGFDPVIDPADPRHRRRQQVEQRGAVGKPMEPRHPIEPFAVGQFMGLAIVDRVMRMHQGRLDLLPREGGGLRAVLCLPVGGSADGSARMRRPASGTARKS